jgi:hypothetical protein
MELTRPPRVRRLEPGASVTTVDRPHGTRVLELQPVSPPSPRRR